MKARAIRVRQAGGPEVLTLAEHDVPEPGPGEVRIRVHAAGVNFIDVYNRRGLYALPHPHGLGQEGAGVVEAVGEGVSHLRPGARVACASGPPGSYAELWNTKAAAVVELPPEVATRDAAAVLLQGLTAEYLLRHTYAPARGDTVLLHAAAGGVGLLFCQLARSLGVKVIGTVSTEVKAELARAHGCWETILSTREDVPTRVRELTGGEGVPVVYDSVGKDTWAASLKCLRPLGLLALFGQSSGRVPPIDPLDLMPHGLYLTRPTLHVFTATRARLDPLAAHLFTDLAAGVLKPVVSAELPLSDAARAHEALEARRTTGKLLLLP